MEARTVKNVRRPLASASPLEKSVIKTREIHVRCRPGVCVFEGACLAWGQINHRGQRSDFNLPGEISARARHV